MPETKDIVTRLRTWPQNNPCYLMEDGLANRKPKEEK